MFDNKAVEPYKRGIKIAAKRDSSFLTCNFFTKIDNAREQEIVQESINSKIKQDSRTVLNEMAVQKQIDKTSAYKKLSEATTACKLNCFKGLVYEAYMESLYLDEDFKDKYRDNLFEMVSHFVDENGGYSILENAYARNKTNPMLHTMKTIIENAAKDLADDNCKAIKNDQNPAHISFELGDDAIKDFNEGKKDIDIDYIADTVKEKVKNTIMSEQKESEEREELINELETDEAAMEAYNLRKIALRSKYGIVKENRDTLFRAIMKHTYQTVIKESVDFGFMNNDKDMYDSGVGMDIEDLNKFSTYDQIKKEGDIEYQDQSATINMDEVLAESIALYTLYETFNTMNLIKMDNRYVTELIKSLK
ncbi:MAG: hypothetical protein PHF63_00830 [Herbinix sp.]|nr:hypothetical protein [Herbinix sp.]